RGLNNEIECMVQETTMQKRRIAELECQLASGQSHSVSGDGGKLPVDKTRKVTVDKTHKVRGVEKQTKTKIPTAFKNTIGPAKRSPTSPTRKSPTSPIRKSPVPTRKKSPNASKVLTGDGTSRQPSSDYSAKLTPKHYEELIEKLQTERDFYYQECLKSRESKDVSSASDN
ncbi:hypothetical protein L9F63_026477, partial [Diploptera punctata]